MKLIIAGGRDFTDKALLKQELNKLAKGKGKHIELVCGMAKGADMLGYEVFTDNGFTPKEFHANWQDMSEPCVIGTNQYGEYNKLAGMKRNHEMGDYATHLLAFWDGKSKGTKDMIEYMRKLDKPVHVVYYGNKTKPKTKQVSVSFITRTGRPIR